MAAREPDDRKLAELILLVSRESANDRFMGAIKLNKVLFHCDFRAYLELGQAITWHPYRKLREGPVPRRLPEVRQALIDAGAAHMEYEDVGGDRPLERLVPDRDPDLRLFSDMEMTVVRAVLDRMRRMTGAQASAETHQLLAWQVADMYEDIPYETAFLGRPTEADRSRARELADQHGWT
ncbi:MAG: SocA family protein [Chloroflexi bacterium]|nr:SocA family protein [Chloroflexota bacterium]